MGPAKQDKSGRLEETTRPAGAHLVPGDASAAIRIAFRILIVDDHPLLRLALSQILATGLGRVVLGEARNGDEALEQVRTQSWDLVILDIVMPGRDGLEILPLLKAAQPALPVLMLSAHHEDGLALRALRLGASGFMVKTSPSDEVVRAVKTVLNGQRCLSQEVAQSVALGLGSPDSRPAHETLSGRERDVLGLIGVGKTSSGIAQELGLSVKTINTYRMRLLQKMHLHTSAELMHYAIKHGLDARP